MKATNVTHTKCQIIREWCIQFSLYFKICKFDQHNLLWIDKNKYKSMFSSHNFYSKFKFHALSARTQSNICILIQLTVYGENNLTYISGAACFSLYFLHGPLLKMKCTCLSSTFLTDKMKKTLHNRSQKI